MAPPMAPAMWGSPQPSPPLHGGGFPGCMLPDQFAPGSPGGWVPFGPGMHPGIAPPRYVPKCPAFTARVRVTRIDFDIEAAACLFQATTPCLLRRAHHIDLAAAVIFLADPHGAVPWADHRGARLAGAHREGEGVPAGVFKTPAAAACLAGGGPCPAATVSSRCSPLTQAARGLCLV